MRPVRRVRSVRQVKPVSRVKHVRRHGMKKTIVSGAALVAAAALAAQLLPDIRRYLRIRRM